MHPHYDTTPAKLFKLWWSYLSFLVSFDIGYSAFFTTTVIKFKKKKQRKNEKRRGQRKMSVKRWFWRHWLCWKLGLIVIDGGFPDWKNKLKKERREGERKIERERGGGREREREREREKERARGGGMTRPALKLKCRQVMTVWESCHLSLAQTVETEVACVACEGRYGWGIWGQLLTTGTAILHCFPSCLSNFF